jgi:hypothetical protein
MRRAEPRALRPKGVAGASLVVRAAIVPITAAILARRAFRARGRDVNSR